MSKHNQGEEVPVVPPPKKVAKIHPDYFTVELPFVERLFTSNESLFAYANDEPFAIIRLNSIYDPLQRRFGGKTGNPDAATESNRQPQGRNIWHSHFKYYRVLKTMVKLTFVNKRHQLSPDLPFAEHYVVGYELVDEDHAISNNTDMFLMTKRAKRDILRPAHKGSTFDSSGTVVNEFNIDSPHVIQTYTYNPTEWVHHVEELGEEERWTPIGENPAIDHNMCIRFMHLNASAPLSQTEAVGVLVQLTYQVQFREQTDSFIKTFNTETAAAEP